MTRRPIASKNFMEDRRGARGADPAQDLVRNRPRGAGEVPGADLVRAVAPQENHAVSRLRSAVGCVHQSQVHAHGADDGRILSAYKDSDTSG